LSKIAIGYSAFVRKAQAGVQQLLHDASDLDPITFEQFFGDKMLSDVTGETCRAYVARRSTDAAARRELEDLRAAINHHRREGLHDKIVSVVLPDEHSVLCPRCQQLHSVKFVF
jgi:hypothetical protein